MIFVTLSKKAIIAHSFTTVEILFNLVNLTAALLFSPELQAEFPHIPNFFYDLLILSITPRRPENLNLVQKNIFNQICKLYYFVNKCIFSHR